MRQTCWCLDRQRHVADLTALIPATSGHEIHAEGIVLYTAAPAGFALSQAATIAWPVP